MKDNINKSVLLKKYEMAYESCIKKSMKKSPLTKPRKPSKVSEKCLDKTKKTLIKNMKSISSVKFKSKKKMEKDIIKSIKNKVKKSLKTSKSRIKKSLNSYQKFVKDQSKKSNIKKLSPTKRLKEISKLWKKQK